MSKRIARWSTQRSLKSTRNRDATPSRAVNHPRPCIFPRTAALWTPCPPNLGYHLDYLTGRYLESTAHLSAIGKQCQPRCRRTLRSERRTQMAPSRRTFQRLEISSRRGDNLNQNAVRRRFVHVALMGANIYPGRYHLYVSYTCRKCNHQ